MAQLSGEQKKRFLAEKLREQRHLLAKSIQAFVAGDLAEGVRLAVSIRVLVHETGGSKPLLGQLNPNYLQLEILDEKFPKEEKLRPGIQKAVVMSVPIAVALSDKGVFLNPKLDLDKRAPSILGKWWARPSLILPGIGGLSRKEIVLGVADKEGGAHVDVNLPPKFQRLLASQQLQFRWNNNAVTPLNLARYMTAQSAVELLDCIDRNFPEK